MCSVGRRCQWLRDEPVNKCAAEQDLVEAARCVRQGGRSGQPARIDRSGFLFLVEVTAALVLKLQLLAWGCNWLFAAVAFSWKHLDLVPFGNAHLSGTFHGIILDKERIYES